MKEKQNQKKNSLFSSTHQESRLFVRTRAQENYGPLD